jgi:membrane protein implicated in regulation of membrane protease activity
MTAYLPAHRHSADCDCYAAELTAYREQQQPQQIVHIHEAAAPDRTIQRVALGSGMGAGAVAAGVYFGPLLVAAMASMAITLAVLALVVAVSAWAVVAVVRSVGGTDGKAAAKTLRKGCR